MESVIAEAEICALQMRYCRSVDRVDFDLLRSCFHPDARMEYGIFEGGLDDFLVMARRQLQSYEYTTHFTGNQLVDVSGDAAWAEHYTVATHRCAADEHGPRRDLITSIRYVDRLARRDSEWRIVLRACLLDWARIDPVGDLAQAPVRSGKRDGSDKSYLLRAR